MKKSVFILGILFIIMISSTCLGANGTKVGNIYSTDIKAYINDVPVKAYNIGGRTCIAIEEVTKGFAYNNSYRTLLVNSFDPSLLIETAISPSNTTVGKIVGGIYSTDIKTYFYNKLMTAYNIGGKTCVAIEDLGCDGYYSDIGGKYIWNPTERTIKLDFLYDNSLGIHDALNENKLGMKIENGLVSFVPDPITPAWISIDFSGLFDDFGERTDAIIPLYFENNSEKILVGYNFYGKNKNFVYDSNSTAPRLEETICSFEYYYKDVLENMMLNADKSVVDRDYIIEQLIDRSLAEIKDRHDAENYTLLYLTQPTPHGSNDLLMYVKADGSYENILTKIPQQTPLYTNKISSIQIDHEKETVTFTMNGSKETYVFDMANNAFIRNTPYDYGELIEMTKKYLASKGSYIPSHIEVADYSNDIVTLHLYDIIDNHTATSDWYYLNAYTAIGTNVLEEPIDLNDMYSWFVKDAYHSTAPGGWGAGMPEMYYFSADHNFAWIASDYDINERVIAKTGTWKIVNDKLVLHEKIETYLDGGNVIDIIEDPTFGNASMLVDYAVAQRNVDNTVTKDIKFIGLTEFSSKEYKYSLDGEEWYANVAVEDRTVTDWLNWHEMLVERNLGTDSDLYNYNNPEIDSNEVVESVESIEVVTTNNVFENEEKSTNKDGFAI